MLFYGKRVNKKAYNCFKIQIYTSLTCGLSLQLSLDSIKYRPCTTTKKLHSLKPISTRFTLVTSLGPSYKTKSAFTFMATCTATLSMHLKFRNTTVTQEGEYIFIILWFSWTSLVLSVFHANEILPRIFQFYVS